MSSLTEFHDDIRSILEDVQKFLTKTLNHCQLGTEGENEKKNILQKIQKIRNDKPHWLNLEVDEEEFEQVDYEDPNAIPTSSSPSHSADGFGKDDEDTHSLDAGSYGDMGVSLEVKECVSASSITQPRKEGYLEKKRKQDTGLFKLQPYQKRWCIIKNNVFYYFASPKDKKQKGAFLLDDYEARPCITNKKDCGLELVCPGHRTYTFTAISPLDVTSWIDAVAEVSKATTELQKTPIGISNELETSDSEQDYIEPISDHELQLSTQNTNVVKNSLQKTKIAKSLQACQELQVNKVKGKKELPSVPVEEEVYDEASSVPTDQPGDDVYDDGQSQLITPNEEIIEEEIYELPGADANELQTQEDTRHRSSTPVEEIDDEEIYDDTEEAPPEVPNTPRPMLKAPADTTKNMLAPPEVPNTPRPGVKSQGARSPLPPTPTREPPAEPGAFQAETRPSIKGTRSLPATPETKESPLADNDIDNLYMAMWDCTAAEDNELSFNRGDVMQIVSREYESYFWMTGQLHGKIGLVPQNYLMKAYERVY